MSPLSEEEIFNLAIQKPVTERAAFLDRVCRNNVSLRAQVESLLSAHDNPDSLLQAGACAATIDVTPLAQPTREDTGSIIGLYKVLQELGQGGMGTVYMAEQMHPVQRKVALKIIKAGMDSRQVIARFEAERQALALMDHPNIAKVLDAGTTDIGRPYFVMELVKGIPVTKYCDDNHLTPIERLELFIPVCLAIQHAHQKGIIHRDIKPSNVLVALYDGRPVPKVIDFGVAKATNHKLTERTMFTQYGQIVGTLEYMSPEQANLNQLDIDTRSDIYSLGVLLYELLTGTTPFERRRLHEAAFDELLRIIREEEPPRPSTRLSTTDELPSIAANRKTEPRKLSGLVRGELDWIVMKALEKDRNRRYETANAFAMDVQCYLADDQVQACPPSAGYRLRKLIRKHRVVLATIGAFSLLLISGTVLSVLLALWAIRAERDTADALLETKGALDQAEADRGRARQALETLTDGVITTFFSQRVQIGEGERAFLRKVQGLYEEFSKAQGNTEAARLHRLSGLQGVASIRERLGEYAEAEANCRAALAEVQTLVDLFPESLKYRHLSSTAHRDLGLVLHRIGRTKENRTEWEKAMAILVGLVAEHPDHVEYNRDLSQAYDHLGVVLMESGDLAAAESANMAAIAIRRKLIEGAPADAKYRHELSNNLSNLMQLLWMQGRLSDAEETMRESLDLMRRLSAESPENPEYRMELGKRLNGMGGTLLQLERPADAEPFLREGADHLRRLAADYPAVPFYRRELGSALANLAVVYDEAKRQQDAAATYREAITLFQKLAADFPSSAEFTYLHGMNMTNYGDLMLTADDATEARRLLEQGEVSLRRAVELHPKHPEYSRVYRQNLFLLGKLLEERVGDHAALALLAERISEQDGGTEAGTGAYQAGRFLAACAKLADKDEMLSEQRKKELARMYSNRAVGLIRKAITRGYRDGEALRKEPDFNSLRDIEEFQTILSDLETRSQLKPTEQPPMN